MGNRDDKTNLRDDLVAFFAKGMMILRGEMEPAPFHPAPAAVDVCAFPKKLSLTQEGFARRFGFGLATVRDWEQGCYQPDQAVRSYITVIEREPAVVQRALEAAAASDALTRLLVLFA